MCAYRYTLRLRPRSKQSDNALVNADELNTFHLATYRSDVENPSTILEGEQLSNSRVPFVDVNVCKIEKTCLKETLEKT